MRIKKKTRRVFWRILIAIPVFLAGAFFYLLLRHPSSAPPANFRVDMSPERVERGRYLFTAVSDCDGCHSERDFSRLGGPANLRERGKGTVMEIDGLPGRIVAENITPTARLESGPGATARKFARFAKGWTRTAARCFL